MPVQGDIILMDGQATPVAHTFSPNGTRDGVYFNVDHSSGVALGFPRLSRLFRPPITGGRQSSNNRAYRLKFHLAVPVLETLGTSDSGITPPPTKSYEVLYNGEFVLPERSSLDVRKDILAYVQSLYGLSVVAEAIEDLKATYG